MFSSITSLIKNGDIPESINQLRLILNDPTLNHLVTKDIATSIINDMVENIDKYSDEDTIEKRDNAITIEKRYNLIINLLIEYPNLLTAARPQNLVLLILNDENQTSLIEHICLNHPTIFTKTKGLFTDMIGENHFSHSIKKGLSLIDTMHLAYGFAIINPVKEKYWKLYELFNSIEKMVPYDMPITDKEETSKIIAKMVQAYFLVVGIIFDVIPLLKTTEQNITEQMQLYLYPFADIILHLLANKNNLSDMALSKPVMLAYQDQYKRFNSFAYALTFQLYQIGVAYSGYISNNYQSLKEDTEANREAPTTIQNVLTMHKSGIIPIKVLIDLNRQIDMPSHIVNIKYRNKNKIYIFPKQRTDVRFSGKPSDSHSKLPKALTFDRTKHNTIHHQMHSDLKNTLESILINRIFIIHALFAETAHEYNQLQVQTVDNPCLTLYMQDYINSLVTAKTMLFIKVKLYNLSKNEEANIGIIDPIYFELLALTASTLRTMLIKLNGVEEADHPCIVMLDKLCGNDYLRLIYNQDAIDFDQQDKFNIDKTHPEWTSKVNKAFTTLVNHLEDNKGLLPSIPQNVIHELNQLIEQYYDFRGLNSRKIFSDLLHGVATSEATNDNLIIRFNPKMDKDSQLFTQACDLTMQKYADHPFTTKVAITHDRKQKIHIIQNFREKEKSELLNDIKIEFMRLKALCEPKKAKAEPQPQPQPQTLTQEPQPLTQEVSNLKAVTTKPKSDRIIAANNFVEPVASKSVKEKKTVDKKDAEAERIAKLIADRNADKELAKKQEQEAKKLKPKPKLKAETESENTSKASTTKAKANEKKPVSDAKIAAPKSEKMEVVIVNVNNVVPKAEKIKIIEIPKQPELESAYHYYHQFAQCYNQCIDSETRETDFASERTKYFIYYNCLRMLDYLKTNSFIRSDALLKRVRTIRNILAHRADLILHSDQYNKSLLSTAQNAIVLLCNRIYMLGVNRLQNGMDPVEQNREEARLLQYIADNTLYTRFQQIKKHVTEYQIHDFVNSVEFVNQLLHSKDFNHTNLNPATLLDVNPTIRDVIKMYLFELGLITLQFKKHRILCAELDKAHLFNVEKDTSPYLDYFKNDFKGKFAQIPAHLRLNALLHLILDVRNFIAHDHSQENVEYPEELDSHFIYEICQALYAEMPNIKNLVQAIAHVGSDKQEVANVTVIANSASNVTAASVAQSSMLPSVSIFKPLNANAVEFKPDTTRSKPLMVTALTFVPKQSTSAVPTADTKPLPQTLNPKASEFKPKSKSNESNSAAEREYEEFQNTNPYPYPQNDSKRPR